MVPLNRDYHRDRAAARADFGEQLANMRRTLAKVERFQDATEDQLGAAVKTFSAALDGLAFAGSPARVGQLLFEKLQHMPGIPELGAPPRCPVPADEVVTAFNLMDRTADATAKPYVVGLDVNAQFLAAAGSVELGTGEPVPVSSLGDGWKAMLKLPGYVQVADAVEVGPGAVIPAGAWIANTMALYLRERDGVLPFAAGWVWPERRRWLALWAKHVRNGRAALMAREDLPSRMALVALKSTYAAFLGGWLASGPDRSNLNRTATLRPDWMHQLHSLARANALRAVGKASVRPFCSHADAFYFLVDDPLEPRGLELSSQPGKWKAHRIGRAGDVATIEVNRRRKNTTLAEQIERGSVGNVSRVVAALDQQYRGAVTA